MWAPCPNCEADISDSWQDDEPDVGIVGGWYCEACDIGYAEWELGSPEPVEDDIAPRRRDEPAR